MSINFSVPTKKSIFKRLQCVAPFPVFHVKMHFPDKFESSRKNGNGCKLNSRILRQKGKKGRRWDKIALSCLSDSSNKCICEDILFNLTPLRLSYICRRDYILGKLRSSFFEKFDIDL